MGQIEGRGHGLQLGIGVPLVPVHGGRGVCLGLGLALGGRWPGIDNGTMAATFLPIGRYDPINPYLGVATATFSGALGVGGTPEHHPFSQRVGGGGRLHDGAETGWFYLDLHAN